MRRSAPAWLAASAATIQLSAQTTPALEEVLEKMGAYLRAYETQLTSVVADEEFTQRVVETRAYDRSLPKTDTQRRRLESEVGFIRLPGGAAWLGVRDVRKIDGRTLRKARTLAEVLAAGADVISQARTIADASAEHNLGLPRTTNLPTAALDIIHPSHFAAHRFELAGGATIQRTRTVVLRFLETGRPPLLTDPGGRELVSRGRVWVAPDTGAVWRIEWIYRPDDKLALAEAELSLRVEFSRNEALDMLVPVELREVFAAAGGLEARGDGVATYRNFRRFGTSVRIVPRDREGGRELGTAEWLDSYTLPPGRRRGGA